MDKIRIRDKHPGSATLRISMRITNSLLLFQLQDTDPFPEKLYPKPAEMLKISSLKQIKDEFRKLKSWMLALEGGSFRGILKRQIFCLLLYSFSGYKLNRR
jgi:hypothetical protein